VTVVVCTSEPDWAVTVIVDVPVGVPVCGGGVFVTPPPPHPEITAPIRSTAAISTADAKFGRLLRPAPKRANCAETKTINVKNTETSTRIQRTGCDGVRGKRFADGGKIPRAVVEMESVVEVAVEPGVKLEGLKLALDAAGRPLAENVTALGNPPALGASVTTKFAVCPAVMVTGATGPPVEKSRPVPVSVMT